MVQTVIPAPRRGRTGERKERKRRREKEREEGWKDVQGKEMEGMHPPT